jgi:activating signal cointegrator complex subunit 3
MDNYVKMMQNKQQVESHLDKGLDNCINAEIAAGQICTISEGVQWLKKSFFYRRMVQNPLQYSVKANELQMDPTGHLILLEKITECVKKLNRARLIRYNQSTEQVYSTDMGRIASNYYINTETMASFMANLKAHTQENMLLFHLAQATEFKQLEARKEEYEEMKQLCAETKYVEVDKQCFNEAHTKVLCLIEAYLKHRTIRTFSLISDMAYVVQNAARLLRAMFEIALQRNYSQLAKSCLAWCQLIDKRLLPGAHVMRQFTMNCHVGKLTNPNQQVTKYGYLKDETVYRLDQYCRTLDDLYENKLEEAA